MRPLLGEFFCLNLCVCLFVCVFVCPLILKKNIAGGPQVIFSDNKVHIINIIIHFQIKLKTFLGPKILSFSSCNLTIESKKIL